MVLSESSVSDGTFVRPWFLSYWILLLKYTFAGFVMPLFEDELVFFDMLIADTFLE